MQGEISRRILDNEPKGNIDLAVNQYIDIFGKNNFYIEVQSNGVRGQKELNDRLYDVAEEYNLKMVATNDTHYVNEEEHTLQDILICVQTGAKVSEVKRMRIETDELFLKSREQILDGLGTKFLEAVNNTVEIAERCNISIEFGKFKFPEYKIPTCVKSIEGFLRKLVYMGLDRRYPHGLTKNIIERTEYELSIIEKMGYAGYFVVVWDFIDYAKKNRIPIGPGRGSAAGSLIAYALGITELDPMGYAGYFVVVWDFIDYAKKNRIPIGPGRGSAAGSLIAYALGITELDPLEYNLIFERFLNPERVSMPDIDIDICQERRQEVIEYVIEKYGADKVAQIITFGTMKAREAIRDV